MLTKQDYAALSAFLVLVLMIIALGVFVILLCSGNAWPLIAIYWAILTLKNACDFMVVTKKDD